MGPISDQSSCERAAFPWTLLLDLFSHCEGYPKSIWPGSLGNFVKEAPTRLPWNRPCPLTQAVMTAALSYRIRLPTFRSFRSVLNSKAIHRGLVLWSRVKPHWDIHARIGQETATPLG